MLLTSTVGALALRAEEERIEVGCLGETGEDSERCRHRILQAEIDSACGLRPAILISLDDARDLAARRIAQHGFAGQESAVFIPAKNVACRQEERRLP